MFFFVKPAPDPYALTPFQQMAASCTGAMITSLFVTPLDVVKIRLQAQQKAFMNNKCILYCNGLMDHLCSCINSNSTTSWIHRSGHFTGTLDAFVKIIRIEGPQSLWSGLPPTLIMAVPSTVIYFTSYEQIKAYLTMKMDSANHVFIPMIAGSTARFGSASVISPLELIRTKMQSKKLSYRQIGIAIKELVQIEGYLSLWRGFIPSIMRDVPFSAIYWTNYEYMKATFLVGEPHFWFTFAAGASSGTLAAVLTLPFDVVKTHRQIELGEKELYSAKSFSLARFIDPPQKSAKTLEILKRIYYSSGPKALFTGIVPRVVKVAPACAMMISTYEYFKKYFRNRNKKKKRANAYKQT